MADYNKIGLVWIVESKIMLCRKHGLKTKLILPGGCVEENESDIECLRREIKEELGDATLNMPVYIGTYCDIAASDDKNIVKTVEIKLYMDELIGNPTPCSEIKEFIWFGEKSDRSELSPILVNHIIPDLFKRGILNWKTK